MTAASEHLRKLEQQPGQPLILQVRKGFTLTAAGASLRDLGLARCVQERALCKAIAPDRPDAGLVRVACSGSFTMLVYPHAIALMQSASGRSVHVEDAPQA